jgi:hypothetical protein
MFRDSYGFTNSFLQALANISVPLFICFNLDTPKLGIMACRRDLDKYMDGSFPLPLHNKAPG